MRETQERLRERLAEQRRSLRQLRYKESALQQEKEGSQRRPTRKGLVYSRASIGQFHSSKAFAT